MGWTHQEYIEQPDYLIKAIRVKMSTFARVEAEEMKKAKQRAGGAL